jgi:ubiquinone/menaquinone biosynthesis C-methylase UbiE
MTGMQKPSPDELKAGIAGVFDRASATYDEVGVDFFRPAGRFLVSRTDPRPGERVLDVGCGRGASAIPAAEAVGPTGSVLATDLAPRMVDHVRRAVEAMPWLQAEVGDAETPPDGPFDVVQAGLVLFFLPSLDSALARYRQVLRPEGRLGFTWFGEPDRQWEPVFGALLADIPQDQRPPDRSSQGPFASVDAAHEFLAAGGWDHIDTQTLVLEVTVRDADHWFEWTWSQGFRFLLERLEADGLLPAAKARATAVLDEMRDREGRLTWRAEIRGTVARP